MRIYAKVIPKSSQNKIEKISDSEYKIWTTAPPTDGKANEAVLKILADFIGVSKSRIVIIAGKTAKTKIIEIN